MVFFPIWGSESRSMQSFLILTNLTQACFFFSLFSMIWKEKKKKKKPESDWSASLLVLSPRQCPHRHQHFVYSLSVMLCLFRLGTHRHTNTRTVLLEVEERRGGRGWREKEWGGGEVSMRGFFLLNVMYSEVLSACGSQTHCVLQVLINSVL